MDHRGGARPITSTSTLVLHTCSAPILHWHQCSTTRRTVQCQRNSNAILVQLWVVPWVCFKSRPLRGPQETRPSTPRPDLWIRLQMPSQTAEGGRARRSREHFRKAHLRQACEAGSGAWGSSGPEFRHVRLSNKKAPSPPTDRVQV